MLKVWKWSIFIFSLWIYPHTNKNFKCCKQKYLLSKWMKKWTINEYHNLFIVGGMLNAFPSAAFEWNSEGSRMAKLWHSSITTFEVLGISKIRLCKKYLAVYWKNLVIGFDLTRFLFHISYQSKFSMNAANKYLYFIGIWKIS